MASSKAAGRILEAVLVLGITALFTYIGFSLIAGIAHGGEGQGGGRIIAGVVLLFGWFATESAINYIFSGTHGSSAISLLTTCMGWLAQFLYYLAVYWLLKRLLLFVRRRRQTSGPN
jgi:hypothetical protein